MSFSHYYCQPLDWHCSFNKNYGTRGAWSFLGPSLITDFLLWVHSPFGLFKCPPKIMSSLFVGGSTCAEHIQHLQCGDGFWLLLLWTWQKAQVECSLSVCGVLQCFSLTFPSGLFGAWCLNTCLVPFFLQCLRSSHLETPVPSIGSHYFGSSRTRKAQCLQQGVYPKRCSYPMSCGQMWACCACLQLPKLCVEPKQKPHIHRSHCVELELISWVSWQDVVDQAYCCANCAYTASSLELAHLQLAWMVAKKARLCLQCAM